MAGNNGGERDRGTDRDRDRDRDEDKVEKVPPAVFSADPEPELEEKLRKHPHDLDTKADVGSDESMDASDPPSSARPGSDYEPPPSSGFPDE